MVEDKYLKQKFLYKYKKTKEVLLSLDDIYNGITKMKNFVFWLDSFFCVCIFKWCCFSTSYSNPNHQYIYRKFWKIPNDVRTVKRCKCLVVPSAGLELVPLWHLWQHRLHKVQRLRPLGQLGYIKYSFRRPGNSSS